MNALLYKIVICNNMITFYHNSDSEVGWINEVGITVLIIKNSLWREIKYVYFKSVIVFVR